MTIRQFTRGYTGKDDLRAWAELAVTIIAYFGALWTAIVALPNLALAIPFTALTGLLGVRVYMIQHDCMHRAFFSSRRVNDLIGQLTSPITLSPYVSTRYNHNLHHAHVGDLDHREAFEIDIMTITEYRAAPLWQRAWYRFYRSPFTLLVVGPFVLYLVLRRFPRNGIKTGLGWVLLDDAMVLGYFAALYALAGWAGVYVLLGSIYVGTTLGAIIPYVVHNFEQVYWGRKPDYTYEKGALQGSSVLRFGALFDLMTLNIGYHDLHHLNANIPAYRLKQCFLDAKAAGLLNSHEITLREALACYGWKLYDEDAQRMVGFSAARESTRAPSGEAA
ncbi:fatty acid desaturase [Rhodalgimonas zhirmunskyi]|uniref:Fatty acid desaturase n=1 Tax=Rhodalgimonas zhirmunskyi TaxID=2964767 RepID=A0AAJ1U535_9RHOB|nr:fatty acid desaturase [Rhodoalgimonas zhirmunskyi]MDQ2093305.1 fatty acid desaturase [Rhodoalgimonas zhirmunskyi]